MIELDHSHLRRVVSLLPADVTDLLTTRPLMLGGGFIREVIANEKANDIDLFGSTEGVLDAAANDLFNRRSEKNANTRILRTKNATSIFSPPRMPVQFIRRWLFDDSEKLVSSFDFTVCQAAVWFDSGAGLWRSKAHDNFYVDLAGRRLVYTQPKRIEEAGGSMLRALKFTRRGYYISPTELGKVVARLAMGHRRLAGFDEEEAARVFSGLLLEVDPLTVVDGLEPRDEGAEL